MFKPGIELRFLPDEDDEEGDEVDDEEDEDGVLPSWQLLIGHLER